MATLFVLLIIGVCGGWEIVKKFFAWLGGLGKKQKSTCSASARQKHGDLLGFDEFCDIIDEGDND